MEILKKTMRYLCIHSEVGSVSEMILYMNSICNIIIYFQTDRELRKRVAQLRILKRANTKLNS